MAITIEVSDTVGFTVKGSINNAKGIPQPFSFGLTADRLDSEQIQSKLENDAESTLTDFLASVVKDWSGVKDSAGKSVDYSEDELRKLCRISGVATIAFRAYLREVGAKEKNS